ncbi:acetyl-CoA carboxylase carboxyltransferase subunit beta [Clostridium felsineum]|uniref:Acetyl-coenzyme A carboxylase carboxyl transferase subunit beta n=1 Tax=Clostridium felsineum TaxID=36839 RepID=A0A1S8L776_9CLOT|nr:acetyl-CoA carboxylase carboxyltransferase subunit beta [Clostridium felsineum]MCR3759106.1 acetyl-CoA carboxylase carboxyl transferase subunit beta [Clostridium felsineum]URZ07168.1 Acetyl-coenzyme A carboxylase carboxyl transferase subunit beta [Clostridium felsineum]URZ12197.1 Acetyl-coenzyme A carboxylase carboxyl transferase subunit beta [Clostridium felsineum]URZ16788.1 Acetyl-coenzyme A carboxylase carboxyl transferase subunit beta [Clostridium felsineum DSM 794]
MFIKCPKCGFVQEKNKLAKYYYVCSKCNFYQSIDINSRIDMITDKNTFHELDNEFTISDPLNFDGYKEKLHCTIKKTKLNDAVVVGESYINGIKICLGILDSSFMMATIGAVVGEKIARLFDYANEKNLPVIIFCTSGGARLQEGLISFVQFLKVSCALSNFSKNGGLYISVLTNPTFGGVSASFGFSGDIVLAEPNANIGFAGKRVVEQIIKEKIPDNFQTSEYLIDNGFIDAIVPRKTMKSVLTKLLKYHIKQ